MAPDTQQNILYTGYFILLHNAEAILYALGILCATIFAFAKPSRTRLLLMWGFIILLFAFEYNKHILPPLQEQTVNSLVTVRESARIERVIHIVLARLIPLGLPLLGWILVVIGVFGGKFKSRTKEKGV
ncbi:MAG: hypothetical protein ACEQSA_04690 [Weeksellaceae bacterium]